MQCFQRGGDQQKRMESIIEEVRFRQVYEREEITEGNNMSQEALNSKASLSTATLKATNNPHQFGFL